MFRKLLALIGTVTLALGLAAVAVAAPASATHPTVTGTAACNPATGSFDITWRVSGDTAYPNETATIATATISSSVAGETPVTTTSLIGQTVKNAGYVEAVQQAATVGAKYQLTVQVQWTNHRAGDLVSKTSTFVTPSGGCTVVPPTVVAPTVTYELGACYQNGTAPNLFSSSNLYLVFDNSASTVPVTFSVPGGLDVTSTADPTPSIVRTVAPGDTVKVETNPIWNQGGAYAVQFDGVPGVTIPDAAITVPAYTGCLDATPGDPGHSDESCTVNGKTLGSITVGLEAGLVYSIDGPGTHISPVTTATTSGLAAGDYVVTVAAASGYVLKGADNWPLTIKVLSKTCGQLDTHPLVTPTAHSTPLTCTAAGSYTLDSNPGVIWTVDGKPATAGTYQVTATRTVVASATPNAPNYGFEAGITNPKTFTFDFTKPTAASCGGQLTTLAFTGMTSSPWLLLAVALVVMGIGGLFIARRRWVSGN